jgi:hypothetical protein
MVVGEVGVVQIGHVEGSQHPVEPSRLVHDLVGDGELDRVSVRGDEDDAHEGDDVAPAQFQGREEDEELDVDGPGEDHRQVERHPEEPIIPLQLFPLLRGGVSLVQAEDLIEDGEEGIDDCNEDEGDFGVGVPGGKEADHAEQGEGVIGEGAHDERILTEEVNAPPGEALFELGYHSAVSKFTQT